MGVRKNVSKVFENLALDGDERIRIAICEAFPSCGNEAAVEPLAQIAAQDADLGSRDLKYAGTCEHNCPPTELPCMQALTWTPRDSNHAKQQLVNNDSLRTAGD